MPSSRPRRPKSSVGSKLLILAFDRVIHFVFLILRGLLRIDDRRATDGCGNQWVGEKTHGDKSKPVYCRLPYTETPQQYCH
jgi:hypothetical protein